MGKKLIHTTLVLATLTLAWHPRAGHATVIASLPPLPPGDYYASLGDCSYDLTSGDPFAGGEIYINPNGNGGLGSLDFADITLPSLSLQFDTIQSQGVASGNKYDATLEDTTDKYDLNLVLDDWSALVAGADGATVDSTTDVVQISNSSVIADNFTGQLEVPAPPALPVFATALGLTALFYRRRKGQGLTTAL